MSVCSVASVSDPRMSVFFAGRRSLSACQNITSSITALRSRSMTRITPMWNCITLVPRAAILLTSAKDRELWHCGQDNAQAQKLPIFVTDGNSVVSNFRGCVESRKSVTRRLPASDPARPLDPWRWPKGSQLWGREWNCMRKRLHVALRG